MDLTCPKCQGAMRSYERSGVTVDQCTECRGIFLDRGELEKLVDAENAHNATVPAGPAPAASPSWGTPESGPRPEAPYRDDRHRDDKYRDDRSYGDRSYGDPRYSDPRYRQKKKKSFLEELFD